MFYSKTGKPHGRFKNVDLLHNCDNNSEHINFYWNIFDEINQGVSLQNCIEKDQICLLKNQENVSLHIDFKFEIITYEDCETLKTFVSTHNIQSQKVVVYVQDELQKRYILSYINAKTVIFPRHYITVDYFPKLVKKCFDNKKFSLLCRRHTESRLKFVDKLYKKKILKNSHWSYLGIDTDNNQDFSKILSNSKKGVCRKIPKKLTSHDRGKNQDTNILYNAIQSSLIHILIETVYDQTVYTGLDFYSYHAMPTDISEKTFKAVSLKKPFLVFSTSYWLHDFRYMGFKTFSPYIDESYDLIENDNKRMDTLVQEIDRLNRLSKSELENVVKNCREITEHNFQVWKTVYDKFNLNDS